MLYKYSDVGVHHSLVAVRCLKSSETRNTRTTCILHFSQCFTFRRFPWVRPGFPFWGRPKKKTAKYFTGPANGDQPHQVSPWPADSSERIGIPKRASCELPRASDSYSEDSSPTLCQTYHPCETKSSHEIVIFIGYVQDFAALEARFLPLELPVTRSILLGR